MNKRERKGERKRMQVEYYIAFENTFIGNGSKCNQLFLLLLFA